MVLCLQNQLKLSDALINNIRKYHSDVKQKCKQMFETSGTLPDNLDEHVFSGKYAHSHTLQSILDLLEFLICQSQQESNKTGQRVALGIENIKQLWSLFVNEPNFQSDQSLFLDWVNKTRTAQQTQMQALYQQQPPREIYLFTEEEKKFLFTNILCNPQEVDAAKIGIGLVKCWIKYFKLINRTENHRLDYAKKMLRVNDFENLLGMDALW